MSGISPATENCLLNTHSSIYWCQKINLNKGFINLQSENFCIPYHCWKCNTKCLNKERGNQMNFRKSKNSDIYGIYWKKSEISFSLRAFDKWEGRDKRYTVKIWDLRFWMHIVKNQNFWKNHRSLSSLLVIQ